VQSFAIDALQDFAQKVACSRFGQRALTRFSRRFFERARDFQRLALAGQLG
jgi:hypothetical protein